MPQGYGIPGRTRDSKDNVIRLFRVLSTNDCPQCDGDAGTICPHEVPTLRTALDCHGEQVEQQVEALGVSLSILKVGRTWNTETAATEYSELFQEPLPWPNTETHRHQCNGDDAA